MASISSLSDPAFRDLFDTFQYTAYRLETLPAYDVAYEEDSFKRFLQKRERGDNPSIGPWAERVRKVRPLGKRFQRVHIVSEPLTDYLRFEFAWSYRDSFAAGEDIRILRSDLVKVPAEAQLADYWLFDSTTLVSMRYKPDGQFDSAEITEEPAGVITANRARDAAVSLSIPFGEYDVGFDEWMNRAA